MTNLASRPLHVFLCHAKEDKPTVRELYRQLDTEGWIDAWLDVEKLYPGQDWNFEIEKAVEKADVILVCLSNNSVTKEGYVQRELRIVLDLADYKPEGTLFVIPVRLEECEPPRRLRRWQYVDYFPKDDRDRAYARLLVSLRDRAKTLGIVTTAAESKPTSVKPKSAKARPGVESKREIAQVVKHPSTAKTTPGGHAIYIFGDIEFVKVPAGKFLMGSSDRDGQADGDEKPQHTIDISYDYYMARFPVTNEQYAAYVQAREMEHPVSEWDKKRDHPVVNVSWEDSIAYCQWLSRLRQSELPSGLVVRLPTEAEWEKAARWKASPTGREQDEGESWIYPWGDFFDRKKCNTSAGYQGIGDTTPVGMYSPRSDSPYGCADMAGNVWEWTHSLALERYPYKSDDGREDENALGERIMRGGSFEDDQEYARAACRSYPLLGLREENIGFRVALAPYPFPSVKPAPEAREAEQKREIIATTSKYTPDVHAIYTFGDITFAQVPAGKFLMGSSLRKDEQADVDETPQHLVDIPYDYYMAHFPVTNEQYARYVQAKRIEHPARGWEKKRGHPVVNVSWEDAIAYCQWLNKLLNGELLPGLVVRLPTEAEWEKAARGTNGLIYPWGDEFDKTKCNSSENGKGDTTPVGMYSPQSDSPYGCADMAGNVWEWTHSVFESYPYEPGDGREDEKSRNWRVVRGGSFGYDGGFARAASRYYYSRDEFGQGDGFRVVVAPPIS